MSPSSSLSSLRIASHARLGGYAALIALVLAAVPACTAQLSPDPPPPSEDDDAGPDPSEGEGEGEGEGDGPQPECSSGEQEFCATVCGSAGIRTCASDGFFGPCQAQPESCNGSDDDCNGAVDDLPAEPCSAECGGTVQRCEDGLWVGCLAENPTPEICDGEDNDCDGVRDEDLERGCTSECGSGTEVCFNGTYQFCDASRPLPEVCGNNVDENCNGDEDDECNATCLIVVNPSTGDTTTSFSFSYQSSGANCRYSVDGGATVNVASCNGNASLGHLNAGSHDITLSADGLGVAIQCSKSFTVTEPRPSCEIANDGVGLAWSSDAESCTWADNGVPQGAVDCSGALSLADAFELGSHSITLTATNGGVTSTCSTAFTVGDAPSCSFTTSGDQVSWSVDGTSCTLSDGGVTAPVACTATLPFSELEPGVHDLTLNVQSASGPTSCSTRITVSDALPTCQAFTDANNLVWSSDADECDVLLDGNRTNGVICQNAVALNGFTPGEHTVELIVRNDAGERSCSTTFTSGANLPTCSVNAGIGGVSWSSNGTACSWLDNGDVQGDVPCTGSAQLENLLPGNHLITLRTTGPGGTRTCTASVEAPTCNMVKTADAVTWSSNAPQCTWDDNGPAETGAGVCNGTKALGTFTSGNHVVRLRAQGTGASATCSVTFTAGGVLPTCSVTHDADSLDWSSNGTTCTWADNGTAQGAIACTGTVALAGLAAGDHVVTLNATGPGGTSSCSTTLSIGNLPSCTVTHDADSVDWSSDGTSCTWADNGVAQGAVACSGTTPYSGLSAGDHTITLNTTGPGGSRSCSTTVTVGGAALPTCTISDDSNSVDWSSNGTSCTWSDNGAAQGAIACTGTAALTDFSVGGHTITLNATGPGGTRSCSTAITVDAPPALPTCNISDDSNSVDWSSNGTSCTWADNGAAQGAIACTGTAALADFSVGGHTVTLNTTGPGGTRSCSTSFTVDAPPALPTCNISHDADSVDWNSNGTSCTWSDNGTSQGGVACSGTTAYSGLSAGGHTITLNATGPGGSRSCSTSVTVEALPLPTCNVSDDSNSVDWSSNGTSCTWSADGTSMGAVACSGTAAIDGFTTGSHTITLNATGPGGTRSCSTQIAVATCSVSTNATDVVWSSDASTCTWSDNGTSGGSIPCSGNAALSGFAAGGHNVSLQATSAGGNTRTCSVSFTR